MEKERRDKDPILFGVFKNDTNVADRFYFLGDWVDEYCDLTLDKMIEKYKEYNNESPTCETKIPETSEELIEILKKMYKIENKTTLDNENFELSNYKVSRKISKKGFFDRIRSVFKK